MHNETFLTLKQLARRYNTSVSTIRRWQKADPTFPKFIRFSNGCTRAKLSEAEAWEDARIQAQRGAK